MSADQFTAVWVSHSSMGDFLKCPRSYYLKNIYKDPKTGHKIQIMAPPLALGQAVHEVIESLSSLPTQKRFQESLITKFDSAWKKMSGKKGGFLNQESESTYYNRGVEMLNRVIQHPGPVATLAVKIKDELPHYWLSEEDNIILCGKIDWLEYLPETNSVHIIDFKTSKSEEDPNSLQLPIYLLLVENVQKRKASKASYWYLGFSDTPIEKTLPDIHEAHERVLKVAKRIKLARQLSKFDCLHGGCYACLPFESVLRGEAEFIGTNDTRRDVYIIPQISLDLEDDSVIL